MKDIKIRKATKRDIDAVVALNSELADYHFEIDRYYKKGKDVKKSFKSFLQKIIKKRTVRIFVVESSNKIVGFFMGSIISPREFAAPQKIGKLNTAFIEKEYRGKGISKLVFDEFLKWFKKNKIECVEVSVDSRNETGKTAWGNLGFKEYVKRMKLNL